MNYINILFLNMIKNSLIASLLIMIIILLRFIFQNKIKTSYIYIMWIVLLIRLVFPFGFKSNVSIENIMFNDETIQKYETIIEEKINDENKESYGYYFEENMPIVDISETTNKAISILSIIWIFGILVILFIPIITYFTLIKELRKNIKPLEDDLSEALKRANRDTGVFKNFRIVKSHLIDSPSLIGLIKPMIILPKDYHNGYEDSYKILLHEYIHYDKKHLLFQWLFWIFKAINWFNPLMWIAHYLMKQDAEYVCDERAIEVLGDNKGYGNLILDIADNNNNENYLINTVGFSYKKNELKNRIIRIMNKKKNNRFLRIICIICIALLIPIFFTSYHNIEKQVQALQIIQELNIVNNNDIFNAKMLRYEYSSETRKLIVDLEYKIDEEFLDGYSEEAMYPLFYTQLLFPGSKDPEIRNNVIEGNLYSEEDNLRRYSFYIGDYDWERFGNGIFRIEQIDMSINIEEELYDVCIEDIPLNFKHDDKIDIFVEKLEFNDIVYIEYIIKGYRGKVIETNPNIYGDVGGYKVESNGGGGSSSYSNDNGNSSSGESWDSNTKSDVYTYCEHSYDFREYDNIKKDKIYMGIGGYDIKLLENPIDFKLELGEHIQNGQ